LKKKKNIETQVNAQKRRTSFYAVVCLLAFAGAVQGREWRLAPETLRFTVNLDLGPFWDGVVDINEVAFNPAGLVNISNLTLNDRAGRNWLSISSARCAYGYDQNNLILKEVRIERPQVTLWFDKDTLNLPMHCASSQNAPTSSSSLANIRHLVVNDATLTIRGENFTTTWDGLSLTATQTDEHSKYAVTLMRKLPNSDIDANGTADLSTQQIDVAVNADHTLGKDETEAILTLLDVPVIHDVDGHIEAHLRFAGSISNSATFRPVGYFIIKNGTVNGSGGRLLENLKSRITFAHKEMVSFDIIHASALGGRFHGAGFLAIRNDNTAWFGGHIAAADVNLTQLSQAVGNSKFLTRGRMSARYDFTATSRDIAEHNGEGVVFLDDADLWKMPVVSHLFRFLGTPLTYSDGVGHFKTNGPTIIFSEAYIASPITALEFQKNSYVNLRTQFVDAHAVFVPLRKLRAITNMIPFFRIFTNLQDNLTRVNIRGYWYEPPSKLIHKEVIQDISASTINFFTDTAHSGGQIGTDIVGQLKPLFATPSVGEANLEVNAGP
jgi:hypothetical protein